MVILTLLQGHFYYVYMILIGLLFEERWCLCTLIQVEFSSKATIYTKAAGACVC